MHDLLLSFAGRLDDDALADAREMLASAEVDRALEFLVGCLVAGRIAITAAQRAELDTVLGQVYMDVAGAIERLVVDDAAAAHVTARHRFGGGNAGGEAAGHGVAEAARRVLDVLPDVRSVWAVWRLTPAGAVSGPVPHRVVLVGVGPNGFAPATSYRLEHALRRAGIRASVEVLRDGTEAPEYHHSAMQYAAQVPFARQAPTNPTPVRPRGNPEPPRAEPPPHNGVEAPRSRIVQAPDPLVARAPEPPRAPTPQPAPAVPDIAPPSRRSRPEPPADPLASANPPPRPAQPVAQTSWLSDLPESTRPKPPKVNGHGPGDESLSEQEKQLLRQLQEELARREQEETEQARGRHGGPTNTFDWPTASGSPTVVNGIPPQPPDPRR